MNEVVMAGLKGVEVVRGLPHRTHIFRDLWEETPWRADSMGIISVSY
jgi:hypothetical protein